MRRFAVLAGLVCGCGTGSAVTARAPSRVARAREGAPLEFAGQQGTAPSGQLVALGLPGDAPSPRVKVAYADGAGWLSAGIFGAGDGRTLSVQPISHRLDATWIVRRGDGTGVLDNPLSATSAPRAAGAAPRAAPAPSPR